MSIKTSQKYLSRTRPARVWRWMCDEDEDRVKYREVNCEVLQAQSAMQRARRPFGTSCVVVVFQEEQKKRTIEEEE